MSQVAKPRRDVRELLRDPRTVESMAAVLPRHMTAERMARLAMLAVTNTPKLLDCEPMSLLAVFLGCSALGMEPNTPAQHLHLVPFKNNRSGVTNVTVIIGYRGYIDLGRRSGLVRSMHADVVYPDDEFDYGYGTETFLKHKPKDWNGPIEGYTDAYCHVALADGGQAFSVMPRSRIMRIRDGSQGYQQSKSSGEWSLKLNPWVKHEDRMARKSAIRNLYSGGEVPTTVELQSAIGVDDRRVDFRNLIEVAQKDGREAALEYLGNPEELPGDDSGPDARGAPRAMPQPQQPAAEPEPAQELQAEPAKASPARRAPASSPGRAAVAPTALAKTAPMTWQTHDGATRKKPNVQTALNELHSDLKAEVQAGTVVMFANANREAIATLLGAQLTPGWRQTFLDLFAEGGVDDPLNPPADGDEEAGIDPEADASGQDVDGDPGPSDSAGDGEIRDDMFRDQE